MPRYSLLATFSGSHFAKSLLGSQFLSSLGRCRCSALTFLHTQIQGGQSITHAKKCRWHVAERRRVFSLAAQCKSTAQVNHSLSHLTGELPEDYDDVMWPRKSHGEALRVADVTARATLLCAREPRAFATTNRCSSGAGRLTSSVHRRLSEAFNALVCNNAEDYPTVSPAGLSKLSSRCPAVTG